MKEENKLSMTNSVQVLVAPWERGFTCGVIVSSSTKMTTEQYEMCSTVARGMIKLATEEPHKVFTQGIKGFAEDRKSKNIPKDVACIAESTHDGKEEAEIIDFLEVSKEKIFPLKEDIKNQVSKLHDNILKAKTFAVKNFKHKPRFSYKVR